MIELLVAEDRRLVREALVSLLHNTSDMSVVGEATTGTEAIAFAVANRPNVAIVDVEMPGADGLEVTAAITREAPECHSLIVTGLGRPGLMRRAFAAGATGFLLKDAPANALRDAVRQVNEGNRVIDPDLAIAAWGEPDNPLTERETEVLAHVAGGAEVAQIAAELYLSNGTVRNYLTVACTKLNARTRVDAVRIATEAAWI